MEWLLALSQISTGDYMVLECWAGAPAHKSHIICKHVAQMQCVNNSSVLAGEQVILSL